MPVALPSILEQYGVGLDVGVWVISLYVLLVAVLMPIFGWLGDRYGYRRTYAVGLAGMALFSWAAALAPSFGWLLVFRALQGIFNATTLPSVMGIISEVFPKRERGVAMGVWATVNGAAHGSGPVISGLLVQNFSWPAIFWLNGATAFLGSGLIFLIVPPDRKHDRRPFDFVGAAALTLAMLTFMFTLKQSGTFGWGSGMGLALWTGFLALMALFVVTERRVPQPFVELRLFGNWRYTAVTAVSSAQFFCLMGLPILLSLYLIQLRGFGSGAAGLLIAPLATTLALSSPLAGRAADYFGYRATMIGGMAAVAVAAASLLLWGASTPAWVIVITLIVMGLGMGFTQSPSAAAVTLVVRPDELGVALGIFNMLRFISGTLAATIFGIILEYARSHSAEPLVAFHVSFYLLVGVAALAVVLAITMPRPPVAVLRLGTQRPGVGN